MEALAIGPQDLTIYYTNHRYEFESEAIGRLMRVLLADAPPSVEAFHLVPVVAGEPMQDVLILARAAWSACSTRAARRPKSARPSRCRPRRSTIPCWQTTRAGPIPASRGPFRRACGRVFLTHPHRFAFRPIWRCRVRSSFSRGFAARRVRGEHLQHVHHEAREQQRAAACAQRSRRISDQGRKRHRALDASIGARVPRLTCLWRPRPAIWKTCSQARARKSSGGRKANAGRWARTSTMCGSAISTGCSGFSTITC